MKAMLIGRMLLICSIFTGLTTLDAFTHKPIDTPYISRENNSIPFKLMRNKIIVPVRVNNSKELNIILDTGMPSDGLLLFEKELADELKLTGASRYRISGAGKGKVTYATRTEANLLTLAGNEFKNQSVLILDSDTMHGFPTDGVIGGTVFNSQIVHIDYDTKIITLIEPSKFKSDPTWEEIPLTFNEHGIPFVDASLSIKGETEIDVSLYIDLASSEALELLVKPKMKFSLPDGLTEKHLGRGLDGDIFGHFGRISSFRIGNNILRDVPTAFPQAAIRSRQRSADGILCNNALRRFNFIFYYVKKRLYIKPNRFFNKPFFQDRKESILLHSFGGTTHDTFNLQGEALLLLDPLDSTFQILELIPSIFCTDNL
jgi:hypothetical protein